ncbi:hypothetical protein [Parvularcula maris]|uniref:Uncharacterized protein n=1 Tax=Parvularcula maris TaxID=2965077 RepID=A0A9X2LAA6_9PROT|nr:hypothetical protein [Parvularcula maris]MCQ8185937.1 hypothetical protein [Parvularcula maris]
MSVIQELVPILIGLGALAGGIFLLTRAVLWSELPADQRPPYALMGLMGGGYGFLLAIGVSWLPDADNIDFPLWFAAIAGAFNFTALLVMRRVFYRANRGTYHQNDIADARK